MAQTWFRWLICPISSAVSKDFTLHAASYFPHVDCQAAQGSTLPLRRGWRAHRRHRADGRWEGMQVVQHPGWPGADTAHAFRGEGGVRLESPIELDAAKSQRTRSHLDHPEQAEQG